MTPASPTPPPNQPTPLTPERLPTPEQLASIRNDIATLPIHAIWVKPALRLLLAAYDALEAERARLTKRLGEAQQELAEQEAEKLRLVLENSWQAQQLRSIAKVADRHHFDQPKHLLLHTLTVDIPALCKPVLPGTGAPMANEPASASPAAPDAAGTGCGEGEEVSHV